MKAFLTVIGSDKTGIIAQVSNELYKLNINILDISQTVMQNYFAMIMLVDLSNMNVSFGELKDAMAVLSKQIKMDITIQREEIFNAMHRI